MKAVVLGLALFAACAVQAQPVRSASSRFEFKRQHPCPSTGQRRGSCPGYVIDHVQPICAGGPDSPSNMQWQTVDEAKAKDRQERRMCRRTKHAVTWSTPAAATRDGGS